MVLLARRYFARGFCSGDGNWGPVRAMRAAPIHTPLVLLPLILVDWIGYGTALESSQWQATLGKRLLGLRVYTAEGGRLTPLQAASRNLIKDGPCIVPDTVPAGQLLSLVWVA
jgi:uncharacterized RDD family membrane protein YckC